MALQSGPCQYSKGNGLSHTHWPVKSSAQAKSQIGMRRVKRLYLFWTGINCIWRRICQIHQIRWILTLAFSSQVKIFLFKKYTFISNKLERLKPSGAYLSLQSRNSVRYITTSLLTSKQNKVTNVLVLGCISKISVIYGFTRHCSVPKI